MDRLADLVGVGLLEVALDEFGVDNLDREELGVSLRVWSRPAVASIVLALDLLDLEPNAAAC